MFHRSWYACTDGRGGVGRLEFYRIKRCGAYECMPCLSGWRAIVAGGMMLVVGGGAVLGSGVGAGVGRTVGAVGLPGNAQFKNAE